MIQRFLLGLGLCLATVLLGKFAIDFLAQDRVLGLPFTLLVLATVIVGAANLLARSKTDRERFNQDHDASSRITLPGRKVAIGLLVAGVPLGFLAASLDCTGLSLSGCSPFCTFVKDVWVPMIAVGGAAYLAGRNGLVLTAMAGMSFLPLVPHCVCYNLANAWWIDHLGASPTCYAWGLAVSTVALSALARCVNRWVSVVMCYTVIAGALGFFVGHHYFHFPW